MKKYNFSDKKVILYATGGLSRKVEKALIENHLQVDFFIDMRAAEIVSFNGKKVYDIQQAEKKIEKKDDYVVVITTKNVFEHSKIASELANAGFYNVIYKDYAVLQGEKEKESASLDAAFECLLNGGKIPKFPIMQINISVFTDFTDSAFIKRDQEQMTVYLPGFMLFTNSIENWVWSRVNFKTSFLTIELYRQFENGMSPGFKQACDQYIKFFAEEGAKFLDLNTKGSWPEFVIDGRMEVYREMNRLFCLNPGFFVENCPAVKGRPDIGYELISSGKNRVAFLMAKGCQYVPVKMTEDDYDRLINRDRLDKLIEYIRSNHIFCLDFPIPHPYFYKYPVVFTEYEKIWLERVGTMISEDIFQLNNNFNLNGCTVSVYGNDEGSAERYFHMLGFQTENKNPKSELAKYINELLYFEPEKTIKNKMADYTVCFDETDASLERCLNETKRICFVAGENGAVKRMIESKGDRPFRTKEIFMTLWNKKYYSGYALYLA